MGPSKQIDPDTERAARAFLAKVASHYHVAPGDLLKSTTTSKHRARRNPPVKARDLVAKAVRAAASAKMLLDAGDIEGACNRAYYAMFDAARAALLASGAPVAPEIEGRTTA